MKLNHCYFPVCIAFLVTSIYYKALFNFFTHDDWFHFRIAKADSLGEFLNFFNVINGPDNWGYYRPLTTQVIYFLNIKLFNYSPLVMHLFAFILFFILLFIVYKLILLITQNKTTTQFATAIYAISSSHFEHLYSIANQELGHGIFYLTALYFFIKFLIGSRKKHYFISLAAFIGALLSKEMSVTYPMLLFIITAYYYLSKKTMIQLNHLAKLFIPIVVIWGLYLYLHIYHYGMVTGDSYIWNISPKVAVNSLIWYALWSVNIPIMLVDFIGPGLKINPNLLTFWSKEMIPIFSLFVVMFLILLAVIVSIYKKTKRQEIYFYIMSACWFIVPLSPVIFLQWHKYPTYLTISLVGVALVIGTLLQKFQISLKVVHLKLITLSLFFISFILLSKLTNDLNFRTNWLTTGAQTCLRVYNFINANYAEPSTPITIAFYDQPTDADLPWSPSQQLKVALSDQNFFTVFYPGKISAKYVSSEAEITDPSIMKIPARQFMGY